MKSGEFRIACSYLFVAVLGGFVAISVLAVLEPSLVGISSILIAIATVAAAVDGWALWQYRKTAELADEEIGFVGHRHRESAIAIRYRISNTGYGRIDRLFLKLPIGFDRRKLEIPALNESHRNWVTHEAVITPARRGLYSLDHIFLVGTSTLGFWRFRDSVACACKLKVYPNLQAEDPEMARFLTRRDMTGMTLQRDNGMGREFDRLRLYQHGDPFFNISWKASAKRRLPISIAHQVERTQQVYALIDFSRMSRRLVEAESRNPLERWGGRDSAAPMQAVDRFINAAQSLSLTANSQGDQFGMIAFSRFPSLFLKARAGYGHFSAMQNALVELEADDAYPDYDELFSQVRTKIRSRSLLVVFTHFDEPNLVESFMSSISLVAKQHLVIAVTVVPRFAAPLFSSSDVEKKEDLYEKLAGHIRWSKLRETEKLLASKGIKLLLSPSESLCSGVVSRYLKVKERQLV